jgi:S-methylmethionine-dependent homocysteine/selenocysteine methylase
MDRTITILDGGMGRELMRIGAPFRQPEWSALALMEVPTWVVRAHTNFIEAGAEVITTNSYAVVPFHIGDERFDTDGRRLADVAGRCAREAAATSATKVDVAGSLPPLFGSYRPDLFDPVRAPSVIDPLIDGLAAHCDIWLGETLGSIAEAQAVRAGIDRAGVADRPLWISYTLDDQTTGALRSHEPVADAVLAALDLGATAVLFNCCQAETITAAMATAVELVGDRARIGAYANRFLASHGEAEGANEGLAAFRDDLAPHEYREFVQHWVDAGATIIGGCCGMEPAHIADLAHHVHHAH